MLKMHEKPFGGRAPPGPAGELKRSPKPLSRNMGPTSKGAVAYLGGHGSLSPSRSGKTLSIMFLVYLSFTSLVYICEQLRIFDGTFHQ